MATSKFDDAINNFLNGSKINRGIMGQRVTAVWEQVMGKTVARYTRNIQVVNRKIFITTDVAPLRNELMFEKKEIILKLNEALGASLIDDIVFQ